MLTYSLRITYLEPIVLSFTVLKLSLSLSLSLILSMILFQAQVKELDSDKIWRRNCVDFDQRISSIETIDFRIRFSQYRKCDLAFNIAIDIMPQN